MVRVVVLPFVALVEVHVCVCDAATTATKEKEECNGEKWHMFVAKKEVNSSAVPRLCWFYNIEI